MTHRFDDWSRSLGLVDGAGPKAQIFHLLPTQLEA